MLVQDLRQTVDHTQVAIHDEVEVSRQVEDSVELRVVRGEAAGALDQSEVAPDTMKDRSGRIARVPVRHAQ